jgi:hypothetical protein
VLEPTTTWYYVAGLGVLGWIFLSILGAAAIGGNAQTWWAWGCGVIGALLCLGAGVYLSDVPQVRDLAGALADFRIVAFVIFVVVLVMTAKLVAGGVPDQYHPISITTGLAVFAVLLPTLAGFVPGSAGTHLRDGVDSVSAVVIDQTDGLFG